MTRDEVKALQGQYDMIWEEGDEEEETVEILELYRGYAGVKRAEQLVVDVLVERGRGLKLFVGKKLDSTSTHGTGCTLSSAIACAVATRAGSDGEWMCPASKLWASLTDMQTSQPPPYRRERSNTSGRLLVPRSPSDTDMGRSTILT